MITSTEQRKIDPAQLAGRLAEMRAEVREYAALPENADIRERLLETMPILERMINELARRELGW
jgi:hypothetical protein